MSTKSKSTAAWNILEDGTRIAMNKQARNEAKALIKKGIKVLFYKPEPIRKEVSSGV